MHDEVGERDLISGLDVGRENEVSLLLPWRLLAFLLLEIGLPDQLKNFLPLLRVAEVQTALTLVIFNEEVDFVQGFEQRPDFLFFLQHRVVGNRVPVVVSVVQVLRNSGENLHDLLLSSVGSNHDWSDSVVVGEIEVDPFGDEEVEEGEILVEHREVSDHVSIGVLTVVVEVLRKEASLLDEGLYFGQMVFLDRREEPERGRSLGLELLVLFREFELLLLGLLVPEMGMGVGEVGVLVHADIYFGILLRLVSFLENLLHVGNLLFLLLGLRLRQLGHVQFREKLGRLLVLAGELVVRCAFARGFSPLVILRLIEASLAVVDVFLHVIHAHSPFLLRVLFGKVEALLRGMRHHSFRVEKSLFVK